MIGQQISNNAKQGKSTVGEHVPVATSYSQALNQLTQTIIKSEIYELNHLGISERRSSLMRQGPCSTHMQKLHSDHISKSKEACKLRK
jgi:hypothetical protein